MKIYIDESGDLGFSERASPYFVIACIIVYDPHAIRRCFAKIRKNKLKKKFREIPEFKFNNSSPEIKKRVLSCIAASDVDIVYSVLRKDQLDPHLKDKYQTVYNYLTASTVVKCVKTLRILGDVDIIVDKSLNGIQREAFDHYLVNTMFEKGDISDLTIANITIDHLDSQNDPCIQAVDFIAGAVHYFYRTGDDKFLRIFRDKIKMAFDYFEGQQK